MTRFGPFGTKSSSASQRPSNGATRSVSNKPGVAATVPTSSGSASPVTVAVPTLQRPTLWKTLLSSEYLKYIDGDERSPPDASVMPGAPGATCQTATSSSASGYGSGFNSTLLTTLKTATVAPMPTASVRRTVTAKLGVLAKLRAWRRRPASSVV